MTFLASHDLRRTPPCASRDARAPRGIKTLFCLLLVVAGALPVTTATGREATVASGDRAAIVDGAGDASVIWNPQAKRWWMFHAAPRATRDESAAAAAQIAIAEMAEADGTWRPIGLAAIEVPAALGGAHAVISAPEVVTGLDGKHHLYLTVESAVSEDALRRSGIAHFTSADLRTWTYASTLKLPGERVSAAGVTSMPGGGWRMWYRNDQEGVLHFADSRDLKTWNARGRARAIAAESDAPFAFTWRGRHWLIVDAPRGLGVYRSLNLDEWTAQPAPLLPPTTEAAAGGTTARQAHVVVIRERAFCFYTAAPESGAAGNARRSIRVVELVEKDGWLAADERGATGVILPSPEARPTTPAATDRDPAEAAMLRALGSRDIRAHDPSTLIESDGEFWVFYTGRGIGTWRSKDLRTWTAGPPVFAAAPAWVAEVVPENRNASFWAPDIIKVGGRYLLYYSVSAFGKRTSAIALATNTTLDPAAPGFKWQDEGVVVRSSGSDDFNAIDPALFLDTDGKLWMTFGSYWSGIKLVELDPATGKRVADAPLHAVAHSRSIEAVFLHRRGSHYYLFVNHGWCCRGVNSNYHIRVGRSEKITGPYVDREGRALLQGGGTVVAESEGPFIGPGHAGIVEIGGQEWFGCHFYDATQLGRATYALRPLSWDADGWPVLGKVTEQ